MRILWLASVDEALDEFVSASRFVLVDGSSERDRIDEIVNDETPGWLGGLVGGLFSDCIFGGAKAVLLKAIQYGEVQGKYGHTYVLENACIVHSPEIRPVSCFFFFFRVNLVVLCVTVVRTAGEMAPIVYLRLPFMNDTTDEIALYWLLIL